VPDDVDWRVKQLCLESGMRASCTTALVLFLPGLILKPLLS